VIAAMAFLLSGCETLDNSKPSHLIGIWGGPHVGVEFGGGLGEVRFDCASGTIDEPIVPLRPSGSFSVKGSYRTGTGGPVKVGQFFRSQEAQYSGQVVQTKEPGAKSATQVMTLDVTLEDGTKLGPFTATEGVPPQLTRCL